MIRVLLADDHAVLRAGLRLLIDAQPDMNVVGECGTFLDAERLVKQGTPDVLVLDLTMPTGRAVDFMERLTVECPSVRVLVLSMHDDPAFVRGALAAGAVGYVVKKAAGTELLTAIRAVSQGRAYVNVEFGAEASALARSPGRQGNGQPEFFSPPLSPREVQVMQFVVEGHTNTVIAERLGIGVKSVETYRARLMTKLGVTSRADLVRAALRMGVLGSSPTGDV
jgi:two-component system, NarL family, response regulator NreC